MSPGKAEHEMRRVIAQAFAGVESFSKTLKRELETLDVRQSDGDDSLCILWKGKALLAAEIKISKQGQSESHAA
jgi:hypothetical protein